MVHEGGLRLVRTGPDPSGSAHSTAGSAADLAGSGLRLQVVDADGRPVQARWPAMLERLILRPDHGDSPLDAPEASDALETSDAPDLPNAPDGRDPERIAATTGGAGFSRADCVQALCENVLARAA